MKFAVIAMALIACFACSHDKPVTDTVVSEPYPTAKVSLSPDTATLTIGDSVQLHVTVQDLPVSVTYASSNSEVVTVSANGRVQATGVGMALVTATSTINSGAVDAALITVLERNAPNVPGELEVIGTEGPLYYMTTEVAEANGFAYTGTCCTEGSNKAFVWNVQGNIPRMVDTLDLGGVFYVGDVTISDDKSLLLVSTDAGAQPGVSVYSLANPAKPQLLDRWIGQPYNDTLPDRRRGTHTAKFGRVNGKLYIFGQYTPNIVVLDASDPRKLREIRIFRTSDLLATHDVLVRDGYLFTGDYETFAIWDVGGARGGTPANPVLVSRTRIPNAYVHNFWWMQDKKTGNKKYLFVGDEGPGYYPVRTSGDIHVFDITSLDVPKEVAFFHVLANTTSNGETAGPHNFHADEDSGILYAAFYNGGVRAIDARGDLSNCPGARARNGLCDLRLMGRELARGLVDGHVHNGVLHKGEVGIWGVFYDNGRVYAADMLHGLHILDASELRR
ncbi:MAG TPA: Ig-like domain-containing protein [Longimicrobiales bacterium]|nr:Ig-like domain-containing protein [Longimicrobiales bacterium]